MLAKSYREIVAHLSEKLVGQPRAIAQLERSLKIAQAGLRDADKPLAILMFAGPTGTGKSEAARALAQAIHGDPDALCRVDCNLLSAPHTASSLTGSPPGYIGSNTSSTLLNKRLIEGKPGSPGILVLEEVEKADPSVWDTLLGIFDKAILNLNNGVAKINFANTFIIMTSNVGSRALADEAKTTRIGFKTETQTGAKLQLSGEMRRKIVYKELDRTFRPEFVNRLDDIVIFRWLDQDELTVIVAKFLSELNKKLLAFPHYLNVDDSAIKFLVKKGFDLANGARPLKRAIRKYVEDPVAEAIVDGMPFPNCKITMCHEENGDFLAISYEAVVILEPPKAVTKPRQPRPRPPSRPRTLKPLPEEPPAPIDE